jgi:hypothetical protein
MWSWQWGQGAWVVQAPITIAANVQTGSTTVTVPAATLPGDNSALVGRQLKLNGQAPWYSIVSNPDASTLILDQGVVEPSANGVSGAIVQAYFMSERPDFEKLITLVDRQNNWAFRLNVPQEELALIDPQRTEVGPPMWFSPLGFNAAYLAALPAGVVDLYGQTNQSDPQPVYESWPQTSSAKPYPYLYKKRIPTLGDDDDVLPGFIRGRVLFEGALADLCNWPGTATVPNASMNPVTANVHEARFQEALRDMILRDEQVTQRTLTWLAGFRYQTANFRSDRWHSSHVPTYLVDGLPFP